MPLTCTKQHEGSVCTHTRARADIACTHATQEQSPEIAEKVAEFITKLRSFAAGMPTRTCSCVRLRVCVEREGESIPFRIEVDDIAGNSFIENPYAPSDDPHMIVTNYARTKEQNIMLDLPDHDQGFFIPFSFFV
jgi:hypothetical protein